MSRLQLQLRVVPHALPRPADDEDEGLRLVEWVRRAVDTRRAPPAAVILRPERTEILPLVPAIRAGIPAPRFLAGLTRSTVDEAGLAYAVALIGVVRVRRRPGKGAEAPPPMPMAVAFVEWPDNRWWFWKALVDGDHGLREGTEVIARAVDGDPMPSGLGRWWALGRRRSLTLHLRRSEPESVPLTSEIVH